MLRAAISSSDTVTPFGYSLGSSFAVDLQAGFRRCRADQVDDHLIADERLRAPVHANEGEQPVLDLVPLARSGRKMMDLNGDAEFVGETLQLSLPQTHARAVRSAAVRRDDQTLGSRIATAADSLPPPSDRLNRESRGVVTDADTD